MLYCGKDSDCAIFIDYFRFMKPPVLTQIGERTSRRSFQPKPLEESIRSRIQQMLDENIKGPFGNRCSFRLIERFDDQNKRYKLGTYGFIQGAQYFIVGMVKVAPMAFVDYGFLLEKIILELTEMGLGTCWLGGTFDRSEFAKAVHLEEGWLIPAITPVGYATANRSIGDSLIRFGAGSKKRKNWEELFFDQHPTSPLTESDAAGARHCLEAVRLAPSASNNQPWRVIRRDNYLDFYLERKPGYRKLFSAVDLQMVDMGIALCHFELQAKETGTIIAWKKRNENPQVFDWEYIISTVQPQ